MDNTISFTVNQLIGFVTTVGGCIVVIEAVVLIFFKLISKAKAPEVEQNRRIEALEKALEEERKERIAKDLELSKQLNDGNDRFNKNDESFVIILETLQALLKHALGGGKSELEKAEVNLNKYLTSKVVQSKP